MRLARTIVLLLEGLLWRATHLRALGVHLVEALGDADETPRNVAGIMLAKSGHAAVPLLREALAQGRHLTQVLTLLGDVGDASVEQDIAVLASDPRPDVAQAARYALRVIELRRTPPYREAGR